MLLFDPATDKVFWSIFFSGHPEVGHILPDLDNLIFESSKLMSNSEAIGYILANGGDEIIASVSPLTFEVLDQLENIISLEQENNLLTYRLACTGMDLFPDTPQYIFCDTAFFHSIPKSSRTYAIPINFSRAGIRRFGGDGLFHQWAADRASQYINGHRVVTVHLSNNPNTASILDGRPVDCSLGYSSLEGIPSMTGCGSIDPSISLTLAKSGMSSLEIENILKNESGWKAITNRELQFNEVVTNNSPEIASLRSYLKWSMVQSIGSAAASLGGMDVLLFAGQDVQISFSFIQEICAHFTFCGLQLLKNPRMIAGGWHLSAQESTTITLAMDYHQPKSLLMMAASAGF